MRMNDYADRLRWEARSCPERKQCPLGFLCASRLCDDRYLLPSFIDVGYGEMIWTGSAFLSYVAGCSFRRPMLMKGRRYRSACSGRAS